MEDPAIFAVYKSVSVLRLAVVTFTPRALIICLHIDYWKNMNLKVVSISLKIPPWDRSRVRPLSGAKDKIASYSLVTVGASRNITSLLETPGLKPSLNRADAQLIANIMCENSDPS